VARTSFDDNTIRYVLPVLWMTSYSHIMGHVARGISSINVGAVLQQTVRFPKNLPGGTTPFDFVVVCNGGKLHTGGEVCCLRLRC